MFLFCCKAKPLECFGIILLYALAISINHPKVDLGIGVSLLRRRVIPFQGFAVILRHS